MRRPDRISSRSVLRQLACALGVLTLLVAAAPAASAMPIITVQSTEALFGGSGGFDVTLSNPGPTAITVGGFSIQLSVPGGSGVGFTGVNTNPTTAPYIFSGTGVVAIFGVPFSFDAFPNNSFIASDVEFVFPGITLGAGDTFGLGHITFDVSSPPAKVGDVIPVTLGGMTALSDEFGNDIPFTGANGTITITPEAASLLIWATVTVCGGLVWTRWRKRGAS